MKYNILSKKDMGWVFLTLNMKNIFNFQNIILIILISILCSLVSVILIPFSSSANLSILVVVIIGSGIAFTSSYKFKNSTLHNTYFKGDISNIKFYFQVLIIMIIFGTFSYFMLYFFYFIFNSLNLLLLNWSWEGGETYDYEFWWSIGNFFTNLYWVIIIIILLFSISFFFRHFLQTQKSYSILIFLLAFCSVLWGGTINTVTSFGVVNNSNSIYYISLENSKPTTYYFLSLLFPFYPPGQMLYFGTGLINTGSLEPRIFDLWHWYTPKDNLFFEYDWQNPLWYWNILYLLPWFYSILFLILGFLIKKGK